MTKPEAVFSDMSDEEAWKYRMQRVRTDAHVSDWAHPEVSSTEPEEVFDRLIDNENIIAPDGDYEKGSATYPDQIATFGTDPTVLLTAEHATIQQRDGAPKEADMGTGGLAKTIAEEEGSRATALVAVGQQTGDAYKDADHPIKPKMADIIRAEENRGHLSLHMLDRGRASRPEETRGYSILLGIGDNPSEATLEVKDQLLGIASDFDLKIGVNAPHIVIAQRQLRRNEDGSLKTITFKAAGQNSTRTYSQELAQELDKDEVFTAIQIEINEVLLARQNDDPLFPEEYDRLLGGYLGYMFVRKAVGTVALLQ